MLIKMLLYTKKFPENLLENMFSGYIQFIVKTILRHFKMLHFPLKNICLHNL